MKHITVLIFCLYSLMFSTTILADELGGRRLKSKPEKLNLIIDPNELRIAGTSVSIGIEAIMSQEEILKTRNLGGKLGMRNFQIAVIGGYYRSGKVFIDRNNFKDSLFVIVTAKKFPDVRAEVVLPLHQERQIIVNQVPFGAAAPGEKYKLEMDAVFDNGDRIRIGSRKLPFNRYVIEIKGGKERRGIVSISDNFEDITNHTVEASIFPNFNKSMLQNARFLLDYKKDYRYFSTGASGFFGSTGVCGRPGEHGEDGSFGPDISVFIDVRYDALLQQDLIYTEVSSDTKVSKYLINPFGGGMVVRTDGGDGGDGGRGGDGRNGADGRAGRVTVKKERVNDSTYREVKKVYAGQDGQAGEPGGDGGFGGYGGDGGDIFVAFTIEAEKYLHQFEFISLGGDRGRPGTGGTGGRGGRGGRGEPDGRDGINGPDGYRGKWGLDGRPGRVFYRIVMSENADDD